MGRKKIYDGKVLFEAWTGWGKAGSNNRLKAFAKELYGQASQMGMRNAMWRWAFENPEEAYSMWKEWFYEKFPDEEQPDFKSFLLEVRKQASSPNVSGRGNMERFCAKYGLPYDYRINCGDVVQIVRQNHPLFQMFLIVDKIESEQVSGYYFIPDRVYPEANGRETIPVTVNVKDIGRIGKVIV